MKTRILVMGALLVALAGCETSNEAPISEEMFVNSPATDTTPLPDPSTNTPVVTTPQAEIGPDGKPYDPALELVEEDPYGKVETSEASGLTERLPDTCKLENYQQYVGVTAAEIEAVGFTVPYRVVGPTDIVTQEYNPLRVNFSMDRNGRVGRISCG